MQVRTVCGFILGFLLSAVAPASPLGDGFTFQGRLLEDGVAAEGTYDFIFSLYSAETGGTATGQVSLAQQVTDGLFTVELDFGPGSFASGDQYWVEVQTRPNGSIGSYTTLSRMKLTPGPYSLYSKQAATLKSNASIASPIISGGTISSASLSSPSISGGTASGLGVSGGSLGGSITSTASIAGGTYSGFSLGSGSLTGTLSGGTISGSTISGGSINGAPVGATTASTGRFTTLMATGATTLQGTVSLSAAVSSSSTATVGSTTVNGSALLNGSNVSQLKVKDATSSDDGTLTIMPSATSPGSYLTLGVNQYRDSTYLKFSEGGQNSWALAFESSPFQSSPSGSDILVRDTFNVTRSDRAGTVGAIITPRPTFVIDRYGALHLFPLPVATGGADGLPAGQLPSWLDYGGIIYVGNGTGGDYNEYGAIYVKGTGTVINRISSHADPRDVQSDAITSFADTSLIPYSIDHGNGLIGKGAVVDVTKALKWVEGKMQQELGLENGKVFFEYELPTAQRVELEEYYASLIEYEIQRQLATEAWVEIPLSNGVLPEDALEEVEVTEPVLEAVTVSSTEIEWTTRKLVTSKKQEIKEVQRGTGIFKSQLREGYRINNGRLERLRTVDDIQAEDITVPPLPRWVLERVEADPEALSLSSTDIQERAFAEAKQRLKASPEHTENRDQLAHR